MKMRESIDKNADNLCRKVRLFLSQKETLDTFLKNHAITEAQYQKSYGDLVVKMDMQEIAKREKRMKTDNAKNEEGEEL